MNKTLQDIITNLTVATGLPGWCTTEKALHLAELVMSCPTYPALFVELGVFGGRSFVPMVLALKEFVPTGFALGIDPWSVSAAIEGMDPHDADDQKHVKYWSSVPLAAVQRRCSDVMEAHDLWGHAALIQARAEHIAPLITRPIDLLHIDGNHTPLASCRDVTLWAPLVRPGGLIVFDDINWPSTQEAITLLRTHADLFEERVTPLCAWGVFRKK